MIIYNNIYIYIYHYISYDDFTINIIISWVQSLTDSLRDKPKKTKKTLLVENIPLHSDNTYPSYIPMCHDQNRVHIWFMIIHPIMGINTSWLVNSDKNRGKLPSIGPSKNSSISSLRYTVQTI